MAVQYIALDEPDSVILNVGDVIFARALEDNERRGMKENFQTFIQFRTGRVHYLYMEFPKFLKIFTDAIKLGQLTSTGGDGD